MRQADRYRIDIAALHRRIRRRVRTDAGMAGFLDKLVGSGNWSYDRDEDVWVVPDRRHTGPGRGFLIVQRGGDWFKSVLSDEAVS